MNSTGRNTMARTRTRYSSSSTHSFFFEGKTITTKVTDKAADVDKWVEEALSLYGRKSTVVGLDIEWRPNTLRYMSNKPATLQLCIDCKCLIIQLFYIDYLPESIKRFCGDPNFTFVGVEVAEDIEKLRNEYGLECAKHADIRELAKDRWPGRFRRPGLKDLAREVGGLWMEKPLHVTMSNWEERNLSIDQVEYASIDAYASYKIGSILIV